MKSTVIDTSNRRMIRDLEEISITALTAQINEHVDVVNENAHVIANVAGLQIELDSKADVEHMQPISSIIGLQSALDGKAANTVGVSGTLVVMTSPTTSKTLTITNGLIVSIT